MKDFIKRKWAWLEAVASDPQISRLPLAIAVKLAVRYFNSETGQAWPGVDRLADELNATARNCRRALDRLVETGYIERRRRGVGGRSKPTLIGRQTLSLTTSLLGRNPVASVLKTLSPATADLERESVRESARGARASTSRFAAGKKTSKTNKSTLLPDGWVLGDKELDCAFKLTGWDEEQTRREFMKFRNWHSEKRSTRNDWFRTWEDWCLRGRDFDERDSKQAASTGLKSALNGLKRWVDKQNGYR
jgi:DNA-binding MarR family transcriptional regulator